MGACLFCCARLSHSGSCCGLPSRASVYRGCPCRHPPVCLDAQGGIKAERQPFVVVGVWSSQCLWWSSKQAQRDFTALLLYAFRVPCPTTILDSWSLECENISFSFARGETSCGPLRACRSCSLDFRGLRVDLEFSGQVACFVAWRMFRRPARPSALTLSCFLPQLRKRRCPDSRPTARNHTQQVWPIAGLRCGAAA